MINLKKVSKPVPVELRILREINNYYSAFYFVLDGFKANREKTQKPKPNSDINLNAKLSNN